MAGAAVRPPIAPWKQMLPLPPAVPMTITARPHDICQIREPGGQRCWVLGPGAGWPAAARRPAPARSGRGGASRWGRGRAGFRLGRSTRQSGGRPRFAGRFRTGWDRQLIPHEGAYPQHQRARVVADAATAAITRTGPTIDLPPPKTQHLVHAFPAKGILQVAATGHFDLVVLIARPRSFLGALFHHSVTAQVLLHSPLPVLVLPAG